MIRAILFDVDGVLIDMTVQKAEKQLEKDWGITPDMTAEFFSEEFPKCLVGAADLKEVITPYLTRWGWNDSVNAFLDYWFASQKQVDHDLIEEIRMIQKQGVKCYVATNQERYRTEYLVNKLGFGEIFDGIFSSAHLGYTKHNPEFFQTILKNIGLSPNEVIFWDDSKSHVKVAKTVGIHAEIYTGLQNFEAKMSQYLSP